MLTLTGRLALGTAAACAALALLLSSLALAGAAIGLATALVLAFRTTPPLARATRRISTDMLREGELLRVTTRVDAQGPVRVRDAAPPGTTRIEGEAHGEGRVVVLDATYRMEAPGIARSPPLRVSTSDRFGLVEHMVEIDTESTWIVLPVPADLTQAPLRSRRFSPTGGRHLVGQAGAGSEFFALREYQPGDTMRQVNWRASARTGSKLVVNQREMESQGQVSYFFDCRRSSALGTWTQNAWADGVRHVASLANLNARSRDRPTVFPYGAPFHAPIVARAGDAGLTTLLSALAGTSTAGETGARAAVEAALPRLGRRSAAVIVSHLMDDARLPDAVAALCALETQVTVLSLDGPAYLRLAGADDRAVEAAQTARQAMHAALEAQGARVLAMTLGETLVLALARSAL